MGINENGKEVSDGTVVGEAEFEGFGDFQFGEKEGEARVDSRGLNLGDRMLVLLTKMVK